MELIPVTIKVPYDRTEYCQTAEAPVAWCEVEEVQGWAFQGYGFTKGRKIVAGLIHKQDNQAPGMMFCLIDYVTGCALGDEYMACPASGPLPEDIANLHTRCAKEFKKAAKKAGLGKAGFWQQVLDGRPRLNTQRLCFTQTANA